VTREDGTTVSRLADVAVGENLLVRVSDGRIGTTVTSTIGDSA